MDTEVSSGLSCMDSHADLGHRCDRELDRGIIVYIPISDESDG